MECQNTIKNLKINKNKMVGRKVVIVVEGESEEFKLLKHIFVNILNYDFVTIKRNKVIQYEFKSKVNDNSTIIVANTANSNISSIIEDNNYKDKLYELLSSEYKESLKNVPIYILWDRDVESNSKESTLKALNEYKNAMDNDENMNGILLLSYPCLESYEISNFDKQLYRIKLKNSEEAKKKSKKYSISKINENTLLQAVGNMHRSFKAVNINQYDTSNFYDTNIKLFNYEENMYHTEKLMNALSLISIMLIDLGIIVEE